MGAPRVEFPYGTGGGGGGGVSGTGTPGTLPIWSTATALSDSPLSFSGSTLSSSSAMTGINFSAAAAGQTWTLPNNGFALTIKGTSGNGTLKLDTNNRYLGVDSPSGPADKLHIAETGAFAFRMQNVTAGVYWQHKVDAAGDWGLAVNGATNTITVLAATGRVGVKTTTPGYDVDINGTLNAQNTIYIQNGSQGFITWNGLAANTMNVAGASGKALSFGSNGVYDRIVLDTNGNTAFTGNARATGTTASSPAFSTPGDTDTGMYFPAANQLRFATGGTQAMNIDASQNLQFNSGYGSVATAYGTRAWVNFDGTSAGTFAGGASTVTRAAGSTTATVTTTSAHGLITGNVVAALTGVAAGVYVVTVTNSTTFTITTVATTALTAVAITFDVRTIRASGNVSSIARASAGLYYVNFAVAFTDANYAAKPSSASPQTFVLKAADGGANPTATACTVYTTSSGGAAADEPYVFFSVVR